MEDKVNRYDPENRDAGSGPTGPMGNDPNNRGRKPKSHAGLIVVIVVAALILFFVLTIGLMGSALSSLTGGLGTSKSDTSDTLDFDSPYIAEISVNGTIEGDSDSLYGEQSYHHRWTLSTIKKLVEDDLNRGLILFVNTPGGGVYESDELYLAIKDYKDKTGRPVYSYMASQATSGGYYISAPADRIIANRNCWTGSIGVTIGTIYDIRGLLKKYGIKTVTIDSGKNKSVGSYTKELTKDQRKMLQSLVDDAYEQFVGIVSEGRHMPIKDVKKVADGSIYTAKQAKKNGLIDGIGTFDEAAEDMQKTYELTGTPVEQIDYPNDESLISKLLGALGGIGKSDAEGDLEALTRMIGENEKFSVAYISEIKK